MVIRMSHNSRTYTRPPMRREIAEIVAEALTAHCGIELPDFEISDANHATPGGSTLNIHDTVTGARFSVTIKTMYAGDNAPVSIPED